MTTSNRSASNRSVAPGEIVLEHVSRSFSMRADQGRTLKGLFVGRRQPQGPPAVEALRDVSLHIRPGETVGLIGRNGAGKSSTLRLLAGIVPPNRGTVRCGGRIVTLLELGSGFSRDFSGRENIYLNGALHGLSKAEIEQRLDTIIAFSELGDFIEAPVKTYSSGMFVRLGFAIAAHLDSDVLLIDELLAVGDEAFQRKCLQRISQRIAEGVTFVLVAHAVAAIEQMCDRVIVLDAGRIVFDGPVQPGVRFYRELLGIELPDTTLVPHPGDTAFEITSLELQDEDGRRSHIFHAGEAVRIALTLRATGSAREPLLRLEVRDQDRRPLFATQSAPAVGAAQLIFEIPRLGLLGGDYQLFVSVRDAGIPGAASYDRLAGFAVADEPGAEGVVDLRGTWRAAARAEAIR